MNIVELFLKAAEHYPTTDAIRHKSQKISYAQLKDEVLKTAAYFAKKGIKPGDRVLVFIPMSIDLYRTVLALFYLGATAVFVDEWVSKKRMDLCCKLADCRGFIGVPVARIYGLFSKEIRRIPLKLSLKKRDNGLVEMANMPSDAAALITFTTGSTGTPKAALRSHAFLQEQFKALLEEIEPSPNDVDLCTLPIVLFMNLGVGCTSVISPVKVSKPRKMKVEPLFETLNSDINRITSSPYLLSRLEEHIIVNDLSLPSLKKVFTGGAPVFPHMALGYQTAFGKADIKIVYGSTECEPISSIQVHELIAYQGEWKKGLAVGKPYHKTEVRILPISDEAIEFENDDAFKNACLEEGEIGEMVVAGDHVLKTYFNNPEAFKRNKIVIDQTVWHRTGDSGLLENGELYLTGRCQQLIMTETGYLSPFVIEDQLQEIKHISLGTLLKESERLLVVVESSESKEKLRLLVEEQLTDVLFDDLIVMKQMPRDPRHFSKVDYDKLKGILR